MSFSEKCKQCTVMVDDGSGVLFQPMSEAYSYVLTAKHNLYNDTDPNSYTQAKNIKTIKITLKDASQKGIENKYEHNSLDIAILKIKKIDFISPLKQCNEVKNGDMFILYGYPNNLYSQDRQIEYFNLKVGDISGVNVTVSNEEYFTQKFIEGCSGGGVFKEDNDTFYLVGIEYRMAAKSDREAEENTRLVYININAFDEIIEQNKSELEPLYPPYMSDFNLLINNIFFLSGMEEHEKKLVQDRLKFIAQNLSEKLKPIDIKNKFEKELFIEGLNINEFTNKELWSMYLEFLVVSIFLDLCSPISTDAIDEIYKKRKFIFAKANEWIELKEKILTSNLLRVKKNGNIIVCCDGDRTPTRVELKSRALTSIAEGIMPEHMRVDSSVGKIHEDLKFKHIHIAQKQMIDAYDDGVYDNATVSTIEGIIKDEINKVFN